MKKVAFIIVAAFLTVMASAQTTKEENLKFTRDFIACHQIVKCALNYNTQPEIYQAFLKEADIYLQAAKSKFSANRTTWSSKVTVEDVDLILENLEGFTSKTTTLSETEMKSATLWLMVADTKIRTIVEKLLN